MIDAAQTHHCLPAEEDSSPRVAPQVRLVIEGNADDVVAWLKAKLDELSHPKKPGKRRGPKGFTPETIRELRRRVEQGEDKAAVAKAFDIGVESLESIVTRRTHKDVD